MRMEAPSTPPEGELKLADIPNSLSFWRGLGRGFSSWRGDLKLFESPVLSFEGGVLCVVWRYGGESV